MPASITDRVIRLLLEVAEKSKSVKLKMRALEKIDELQKTRKPRGPKPRPKPLTDVERLLGVQKTDN
jgi:hypothetical protein